MSEPVVTKSDEKAIFVTARRMAVPEERRAYLEKECDGDAKRLNRLEALLSVVESDPSFMEHPALTSVGDSDEELIGTNIGPYKLLKKLGEGGMGTVFLAEQSQPVKRQVALKIIKSGMDTRQVLARFEAERQALALMDHPNIARILDAGLTGSRADVGNPDTRHPIPDSRPYFVMELVLGKSITQFCDERRLSPRERLELFVPVCEAIQHAHQKGIIHRDIKPNNVMVSLFDDRPVPKVIDFGVAKAVGVELTNLTLQTNFGAIVGTPQYMSPEQAEPNQFDVDTRADIYSLGVLLYELLTGSPPFEKRTFANEAMLEILRIIREVDPPTPSTRLSSADALPSIAANRSTEPRKLTSLIRGELDWIVMKCLDKDRSRRYSTANGLARDIGRYLSEEPVEASPPSTTYRLKKFLRRNRRPVLAASIMVLLLVAGVVGTTIGLVRAEHRAEGERLAKESAVKRLVQIEKGMEVLSSVFENLDPRAEEKEGRPLRAILGDLLTKAAEQLEGEAVGDPVLVAGLQNRLGQSLLNLGMAAPAIELFLKARQTRSATLGSDHADTLTTMNNLAVAYKYAGKMNQALPLHQETLALRKAKLGDDHPDTLTSMNNLAAGFRGDGKPDLAVPLHEEALRLRKAKLGRDHPDTLISMNNLALSYHVAGKMDLALPLYEEALTLRKAKLGHDHASTLTSMSNLALGYKDVGKLDRALLLHEETLQLRKIKLGPDHPDTLTSMNNLAVDLQAAGKLDRALPLLEETLKHTKAKMGGDHPETLSSMNNLAFGFQGAGKIEEALPLYEETLKLRKAKLGAEHPRTLTSMNNFAFGLEAAGKLDQALPLYEETLKLTKAKLGPDHPDTFMVLNNVARVYQAAGKLDAAVPLLLEAATGAERKLGLDHPQTRRYISNLANLYAKRSNLAEAAEWRKKLPPAKP